MVAGQGAAVLSCRDRFVSFLFSPAQVVQQWPFFIFDGLTMSADRDRAVRRQKQKRAKDQKKAARQQPAPAKKAA
jgi:hypothetical protein